MPINPIDYYMEANHGAPAVDGLAITPNDGANLTVSVRGIYVGGAGTVRITTPRGTVLDFTVVAGGYIPFWAIKVSATGTTATLLVGAI